MDCSLPGSSVHRILQAGILEWVAVPFSRGIFLTLGLNSANVWYITQIKFPMLGTHSCMNLFTHHILIYILWHSEGRKISGAWGSTWALTARKGLLGKWRVMCISLCVCVCVCVCVRARMLNHFSRFWLFATPWTKAPQAPLSMGIVQARILE